MIESNKVADILIHWWLSQITWLTFSIQDMC